jgi:hypothetical protein
MDLHRGVSEPGLAERSTLQLSGKCQHLSYTIFDTPALKSSYMQEQYITNTTAQGPSWEATSSSAGQSISYFM